MKDYDLVVIGAGPGGYVAAIRGAQKGLKVAVVEYDKTGGTCLNRGCIPTKSIMHSSHLYKELLNSEEYGILASNVGYDIDKIYDRKNGIVESLRNGVEQLFKANKIDHYKAKASIKDQNTVIVRGDGEEETLNTKYIIIATGSKPTPLPGGMMNHKNVFDSDEALAETGKIYKRIVIVGGGVIGVEFASIYNALGCEVSIIGSRPQLLRRLDREISQNTAMIFKKRGIKVFTPARVQEIVEENDEIICKVSHKDTIEEIRCDGVLVCVGRKPVTEGLFEEGFAVELENGFVKINENLQTNYENIYAIGDCTDGTFLAHAASAQGINAVSHMVGEEPPMDLNAIQSCVYGDPEIAQVGITADEAKEKGIEVKVGKYVMTNNGRTMIANEDRSFIKLVFDAETEVILGAQLMCSRATDLISELSVAIVNKLTAEEIAAVIHPHPTFTEGVTEAVEDIFGLAVHMMPKKR